MGQLLWVVGPFGKAKCAEKGEGEGWGGGSFKDSPESLMGEESPSKTRSQLPLLVRLQVMCEEQYLRCGKVGTSYSADHEF